MLRAVIDPELGDNIVDLGMVGDIAISDGKVSVGVALTIAGCPLRAQIERDVTSSIEALDGVSAVEVVISMMDADQKALVMQRARSVARDRATDTISPTTSILAIASGKGGVGKSSITTNLAVALAQRGLTVGILDADIWGFSIPRLVGLSGPVEAKKGKMQPVEVACGSGRLKVLSMGFLADEDRAIMWRGLVLNRAVQQFVEDADWGQLDYLLVDLPPGTGDVAMGLVKVLPRAQLLVVTTPPVAAQQVAHRAADMARRGYLPVAGVIENMSAFICDHGPSYALFGSGGSTPRVNSYPSRHGRRRRRGHPFSWRQWPFGCGLRSIGRACRHRHCTTNFDDGLFCPPPRCNGRSGRSGLRNAAVSRICLMGNLPDRGIEIT